VLAERPLLALVAWLFTYAIHSTVLIGGAWLAACCLAKAACSSARLRDRLPGLRDRLWKVALVGGIVTATLQTGLGFEPWGALFALAPAQEQVERTPVAYATLPAFAPAHAVISPRPIALSPGDASHRLTTPASLPVFADPAKSATSAPTSTASAPVGIASAPTGTASAPGTSTWAIALLAAWGVGVAIGLARWLCQWNRLLRQLDDRQPIRSGMLFEVYQHLRLRSKTRSRTALFAAPGISAPITLGFGEHAICVPPRVATELQRDEVAALLAHELAHAERRDPLWVAIGRLVEAVFFFQPLNKRCSVWLQDEAEYLADDWAIVAIGERVPLASCLTEIAGWIVNEPRLTLVSGMAAPGTRLALRVRRMLDEDHDPEVSAATGRARSITVFAAGSVVCVVLCVPGVSAHASAALPDVYGVHNVHGLTQVRGMVDVQLESRTRELERALEPNIESDVANEAPCADAPEPSGPNGPNGLSGPSAPSTEPEPDAAASRALALEEGPEVTPGADDSANSSADASPSPAASVAASPDADADFDHVLRDIERELNLLRAALHEREPAPALGARIDELQSELEALRSKHSLLRALLQPRDGRALLPVYTTTLPSFFFTKD
jgi:beta-lactamase regulating signal transducer with metallopeptidase domain